MGQLADLNIDCVLGDNCIAVKFPKSDYFTVSFIEFFFQTRITHSCHFGFSFFILYECVLVTQLCPTLCDHVDCSPLGSSVHGILQARILEWDAIPFSRQSSQPRDVVHNIFYTICTIVKNLHFYIYSHYIYIVYSDTGF